MKPANEGQYAQDRCDIGCRGRIVSCEPVQIPSEASTTRCGDTAT
jgi:Lon protease-like protein